MKREGVKVGVLRIEGTNSEDETARCFRDLGAQAELVHLNQLDAAKVEKEDRRKLSDYDALMLPGGFSAGDYIRAGAIWAARLRSRHEKALKQFVKAGKPVGGICNGFQVLVELGLLPATGHKLGMSDTPQGVLYLNDSAHYECRPVLLRHESNGHCVFTRNLRPRQVVTSVASHGEGKLLFPKKEQQKVLKDLAANNQIVFRYVDEKGDLAGYPWNPNGAPGNVAGVCNIEGNVFGMMPHPERVFHRVNHPDWTRSGLPPTGPGDGRAYFESVLEYVEKRF